LNEIAYIVTPSIAAAPWEAGSHGAAASH